MRFREALTPDERRAKVAEILARGLIRLAAAKASRRRDPRHAAEPDVTEYPQGAAEI